MLRFDWPTEKLFFFRKYGQNRVKYNLDFRLLFIFHKSIISKNNLKNSLRIGEIVFRKKVLFRDLIGSNLRNFCFGFFFWPYNIRIIIIKKKFLKKNLII